MNKIIIVHHNDMDGRCAGDLMYRYLRNNKTIDTENIILLEKDYTQIPVDIEYDKNTVIYFLDFSFSESTVGYLKSYVDNCEKVIWLDHHKTSKELIEAHEDYFSMRTKIGKIYANINMDYCGAFLTYVYIHRNDDALENIPHYISLIDIYDRWQSDNELFKDAMNLKMGIDALENEPGAKVWDDLYNNDDCQSLINNGELLTEANRVMNKRRFNDFGYFAKFCKFIVPVINSDGNSTLFGDLLNTYPFGIRWHYKNGVYTYSIYSKKDYIDCSLLASVYGGGGHKGAAGFQTKKLIIPNKKENLFTKIRKKKEFNKFYKRMTSNQIYEMNLGILTEVKEVLDNYNKEKDNMKNEEVINKEEEYMDYIKTHVDFVKRAFEKFFADGQVINAVYELHKPEDANSLLSNCASNIEKHDASKYSDEEFDIYRKNFYPVNEEERESAKEDFEKACKDHYRNNPHHPEYWNPDENNVTNYIPLVFLIEMCCDLIAVSAQKGGNPGDWWNDNSSTKPMMPADKKEMSDLFGAIYKIYGTYSLD